MSSKFGTVRHDTAYRQVPEKNFQNIKVNNEF